MTRAAGTEINDLLGFDIFDRVFQKRNNRRIWFCPVGHKLQIIGQRVTNAIQQSRLVFNLDQLKSFHKNYLKYPSIPPPTTKTFFITHSNKFTRLVAISEKYCRPNL